ncbi:hypothetical protein D3C80_1615320 [compost metagenome]
MLLCRCFQLIDQYLHQAAIGTLQVVMHGQFAEGADQLAQQRVDREHPALRGRPVAGRVFQIEAAQVGVVGAADAVLDLCRHPYRPLWRDEVEAVVRVHFEHAANGMGQLPPGVRVAVPQDDVR